MIEGNHRGIKLNDRFLTDRTGLFVMEIEIISFDITKQMRPQNNFCSIVSWFPESRMEKLNSLT